MSDLVIVENETRRLIEEGVARDEESVASDHYKTKVFDSRINKVDLYHVLLIFWLLILYLFVFLACIFFIGLLEIRQSNMTDYNGFVAAMAMKDAADTREGSSNDNFKYLLSKVDDSIQSYTTLRESLKNSCHDVYYDAPLSIDRPADSCDKLKQNIDDHVRESFKNKINMISDDANRARYYYQYIDGQIKKTPQMAPILSSLTSASWKNYVFRMPIEWLEMVLLIFMGMLGGLIGATRCLVDLAYSHRPRISDLLYRPTVGAVVALAAFVLFRAGQILLGNENPGGTVTGATGLFLLAFLGLVSGLRAKEVVDQLEAGFFRLFQRGSDAKSPAETRPQPDALKSNQSA
jgi:hypothetical protein